MKNISLALISLISFGAFAQENIVDITMDGKPAKMNTTTGVYTFTHGGPSNNLIKNNTPDSRLNSENSKIHTVNKGETLYSISKRYQISMAQIKSINNLESNILSVNQNLIINYNSLSQINNNLVYIVEKGDSLYRIAKNANTSVSALKQLNNLENNSIRIGQELKLK